MSKRVTRTRTAAALAQVPATVPCRLSIELGIGAMPENLDEATSLIRDQIGQGRRAALAIAVLIARSRVDWFADDPSAWLTWARDSFGYERRHCFRCLKAGLLLQAMSAKVPHEALMGCDMEKLEMLSAVPAEQLPGLLSRWNPAEHTRDEVREKLKVWAPGDEEEKDPEAEAKAARRKSTKTPVEKACAELCRLSLDDAEQQAAGIQADPMVCIRAGIAAFNLTLWHCESTGFRFDPGQIREVRRLWDQIGAELFDKYAAKDQDPA